MGGLLFEAPLQGTASIDPQLEKRGPNMPNAKRAEPCDRQNGDDRNHKKKKNSVEAELRRSIDMCSKFADVMGAIEIYDKVVAEGKVSFNQYNYNVLLYLCSSAATGSLKPGKSGTVDKQPKSMPHSWSFFSILFHRSLLFHFCEILPMVWSFSLGVSLSLRAR